MVEARSDYGGRIYQVALIIEFRDDKIWRDTALLRRAVRATGMAGAVGGAHARVVSWIIRFYGCQYDSDVSRGQGSRGAARCDGGQLAKSRLSTCAPTSEEFVAATTYYLCRCHYGQVWRPLAIVIDGKVVGFVMWALDDNDGSHWIGGLVVDATR